MKKYLIFILIFIFCINLIAKDDLIYHYDFNNKIMYSLEGGMSMLYYDKDDLIYPGTYYLAKYKQDDLVEIEKVKIKNNYKSNIFYANTENDFINYVKYASENMLPNITITKKGTVDNPQKYLTKYLNRTLDKYPLLAVKGFYASHQYYKGNMIFTIYFDYYFKSKSEYDRYNNKMNIIIDDILNTAINSDDPEQYIYKYILDNVSYKSGEYSHTVQGALVDGYAVCDGYSKTFMMLLNMCGIQSDVVSGKTSNNIYHMWNRVYDKQFTDTDRIEIEDKHNYTTYYCDLTFEDTSNDSYYNLTNSPHEIIDFYKY